MYLYKYKEKYWVYGGMGPDGEHNVRAPSSIKTIQYFPIDNIAGYICKPTIGVVYCVYDENLIFKHRSYTGSGDGQLVHIDKTYGEYVRFEIFSSDHEEEVSGFDLLDRFELYFKNMDYNDNDVIIKSYPVISNNIASTTTSTQTTIFGNITATNNPVKYEFINTGNNGTRSIAVLPELLSSRFTIYNGMHTKIDLHILIDDTYNFAIYSITSQVYIDLSTIIDLNQYPNYKIIAKCYDNNGGDVIISYNISDIVNYPFKNLSNLSVPRQNLIGPIRGALYSCFIPKKTNFVITTYDGKPIKIASYLYLYDENKNLFDYLIFAQGYSVNNINARVVAANRIDKDIHYISTNSNTRLVVFTGNENDFITGNYNKDPAYPVKINVPPIDATKTYHPLFNDQLDYRCEQILHNMMEGGKNSETFIFVSDTHWESNAKCSPGIIKEIINRTGIKTIIHGGDLINMQERDLAIDLIDDYLNAMDFPGVIMPIAFGNHDDNSFNGTWTDRRVFTFNNVYGLINRRFSKYVTYISETAMNFYLDKPNSKTRFLFIDTGVLHDTSAQTTKDWQSIINCMMNTPENWHIVFVQHITFTGWKLSDTAYKQQLMIADYNNRINGTHFGINCNFANAKAKVFFILSGHVHRPKFMAPNKDYFDISINPEGLNYNNAENRSIAVPIFSAPSDSSRLNDENFNFVDYNVVSIKSQAFCVCTLNYDLNMFKSVGFGWVDNFNYRWDTSQYGRTISVKNNLKYCTTRNTNTNILISDSYSTTLIPYDDYSITSVSVIMNEEDITSNVFTASNNTITINTLTGDLKIIAEATKNT